MHVIRTESDLQALEDPDLLELIRRRIADTAEYVDHFSELVFWIGFAVFTWSPAGIYIFAISAANLVPRAIATHKWYQERFPDYPKERKALIPFIW